MEEIESERLRFQIYKNENKEDFIKLITDEKIMKHVGTGALSLEQAEKLWKKLIEDFYPQGVNTIWAVFERENFHYIGHAAIRPRPEKKEDWEISYMLKTEEWGKGLATEIARRLIDYGFSELKLKEVFATINDNNLKSIKVAQKAGMNFLRYEYDEEGRFSVYSVKNKS